MPRSGSGTSPAGGDGRWTCPDLSLSLKSPIPRRYWPCSPAP